MCFDLYIVLPWIALRSRSSPLRISQRKCLLSLFPYVHISREQESPRCRYSALFWWYKIWSVFLVATVIPPHHCFNKRFTQLLCTYQQRNTAVKWQEKSAISLPFVPLFILKSVFTLASTWRAPLRELCSLNIWVLGRINKAFSARQMFFNVENLFGISKCVGEPHLCTLSLMLWRCAWVTATSVHLAHPVVGKLQQQYKMATFTFTKITDYRSPPKKGVGQH